MSQPRTPAEQLVKLERELVDVLFRVNEAQRRGLDTAVDLATCRVLRGRIDALRAVVYAGGNTTPVPSTPPVAIVVDGSSRRPSGLLRKVIEHTSRAAEELARRSVTPPPDAPDAITPVLDPFRLAAAAIVGHITQHGEAPRCKHEAYVEKLLRELFEPAR